MKKILTLALALFFGSLFVFGQIAPDKYYIQFTDKDNSPYSISNPSEYLSQRAIDRRERFNIPIDQRDIPVNPQYIEAVRDAGATILNPTKWLNGVTVHTNDPGIIAAIEALPFVSGVVKSPVYNLSLDEKDFFAFEGFTSEAPVPSALKGGTFIDYGPSLNQISMIRGDEMHALGFRGQGMVIAVLDAGYDNANTLPVFDSLWDNGRILGTYDFVDGGEVTFNKHYHGTMVLSCMGGNYPGEIVGTAPEASYWLLRSEDGGTEYIIEEYNWVSAAEFADSVGADVINSSLGYSEYDDPSMNHTYDDMDGDSAPITIGADIAASKGMAVVTSAGNSGTSAWYYITAPADGDSVYSIGAVNWEGIPAGFSGNGPTVDGRTKPNVAAQGEGAYFANTNGEFIYGNGTSFSSPITAGMVACLWQAKPEMNNMQLLNAIQSTASIADAPDNKIGYGIPDFMAANNLLTIVEGNENSPVKNITVFPNPFTNAFRMSLESNTSSAAVISIADLTGKNVYRNVFEISRGMNTLDIREVGGLPAGLYFLRIESAGSPTTMKLVKQ